MWRSYISNCEQSVLSQRLWDRDKTIPFSLNLKVDSDSPVLAADDRQEWLSSVMLLCHVLRQDSRLGMGRALGRLS